MKRTLLRKNWIAVILIALTINVVSAKQNPKSGAEPQKVTAASDTLADTPKAEETTFDPSKAEFPADELNGGSEVAIEKEDYNPAPVKEDGNFLKQSITWLLILTLLVLLLVMLQLNGAIGLLGEISGKPAIDWNKWNPRLMVLFVVGFFYAGIWEYNHDKQFFFPQSASEHGAKIDSMFNLTTLLILIVFFITQAALFLFAYLYRARKGHKAYYYPHNDRLEVIWTIIPAIALAVLITNGLKTWNGITAAPPKDAQNIEIYAYQFGWKARYAGADKELGTHNFRLISAENEMGVNWKDAKSHDDLILSEVHLPVNKHVNFKFRAKDVIHSAYMPYFRAQMNVVPGVPTNFWMKPVITTKDMRDILRQQGRANTNDWDYYIYCNKICGSAHYNMKIKMVVETEAEYNKWLSEQKSAYAGLNGSTTEVGEKTAMK